MPALGAGVALVLAIDVSASVTADSYVLQHDGIARAFENPRLIDAVSAAIRPGACKSPFLRAAAALFQFPHPKRATFAFATRSQAHPATATAPAGSNRSRLEETKCLKLG